MKKLMVYSHDTYGLGNIRRMLAICMHLINEIPDLSILLITGSPMIQSFRLPPRLDYIKLPSLSRTTRDGYVLKSLGTSVDDAIGLRSNIILQAVVNFKPDMIMVDKKPFGINDELASALNYVRLNHPETRQVLVLRDILDSPAATMQAWNKGNYHQNIISFYDRVLILGQREVFDAVAEYQFPATVADKVCYTGYTRRAKGQLSRAELRAQLGIGANDPLVLVTPGGGEDGYQLIQSYIAGLNLLPSDHVTHSLIITGPEMPPEQRQQIAHAAAQHPNVAILEFTDDLMSYMDAADVVVSMGGYNTVCEILSSAKRAVIVPRARPVEEQWIRAERMARFGLFTTIHPDQLSPQQLIQSVYSELQRARAPLSNERKIDLDGLGAIAHEVRVLLNGKEQEANAGLTITFTLRLPKRRQGSTTAAQLVLTA